MEKVVIDAQALFYLQKTNIPEKLNKLREDIINGKIIAIIPSIAICELLWKIRKTGGKVIEKFQQIYENWKNSPNIIIDNLNNEILELMLKNNENIELHDEIIAMTCKKNGTLIIYSKDEIFQKIWQLKLIKW